MNKNDRLRAMNNPLTDAEYDMLIELRDLRVENGHAKLHDMKAENEHFRARHIALLEQVAALTAMLQPLMEQAHDFNLFEFEHEGDYWEGCAGCTAFRFGAENGHE